MLFENISKLALISFAVLAQAHPGERHEENYAAEISKREYKANARRGLEKCSEKFEESGLNSRAAARRSAALRKHRKAKRDTTTVLDTSHLYNGTEITVNSPEDVIFATNSSSVCVLTPEGEVGPFWVPGEYVRTNLRENQTGVPVILDGQFVDVETCEPIQGLYWDIWNCNATGVYGGVQSSGNGNVDDASNLNNTFLRGIWETDADGVVQFETIFPGHYSGRANHVHMIAHLNATVLANDTLTGGTIPHVGQLFWDQDLISAVEATYPYSTNTITLTTNAEDRVFGLETDDTTSDPVIEYEYLTDDISDGLFGWITVAVNISASYDPSYSFVFTSSGSIAETGGDE